MKYIVMECHHGYSVLIGEDSGFVKAANLHYKVGQTVTDPILLDTDDSKPHITMTHSLRKWIMTAAACLLVFAGFGTYIYNSNFSTYSSIIISAEAEIKIELNKNGKVISVVPLNELGEKVLEGYDLESGLTESDVADSLVKRYVKLGLLNSGDTIEFVIDAPNSEVYDDYRNDLKAVADKQDIVSIKANVRKSDEKNNIPVSAAKTDIPSETTTAKKTTEAAKPVPPKKEEPPVIAPHHENNEIAPPIERGEPPKAPSTPATPENAPAPPTPKAEDKPKPETEPKVKPEPPIKELPVPDKTPDKGTEVSPEKPDIQRPEPLPEEHQPEKSPPEEHKEIEEKHPEELPAPMPESVQPAPPVHDIPADVPTPDKDKTDPFNETDKIRDEKLPEPIIPPINENN